jgi:hypothetical protein
LKLRGAWDCLLDFAVATWLGVLDRLAPLPETSVDRAIREEGERLRKAFPTIDFDNPQPRRSPPNRAVGNAPWGRLISVLLASYKHSAIPSRKARSRPATEPRQGTMTFSLISASLPYP